MSKFRKRATGLFFVSLFFAVIASLLYTASAGLPAHAQATQELITNGANVAKWGFIAAALSTGIATLGAGFAVGTVGAAAVGAIAEKPELFGRVLVLLGLAEGLAIYGLVISIIILNRLG